MTVYSLGELHAAKPTVLVAPSDLDSIEELLIHGGVSSFELTEGEHLGPRDWFHGEVDDLVVWTVTVSKLGRSASAQTCSAAGGVPNLFELFHVIDSNAWDFENYGGTLEDWIVFLGDSEVTRKGFRVSSDARAFLDLLRS
jgi:hypothetical protein